jgi:N-acetylneuraminic acid mutarotase
MIRFIKLLSIVITIVFLYVCTRDNPVVTTGGSGTETVGGILVDSTGTPVPGVIVCIDSVDSQSSATFYTTTDANGEYYVDSIKAGTYKLFGYIPPDSSLIISIENIQYTDDKDTLFLGIDTMYTPGGISGRVLLEGVGRTGSLIKIPGTSFIASSDDSGSFTMIVMIPGIYVVDYEHTGYRTERDLNVMVMGGSITQVGTKNLVLDTTLPPPPPENLSATYDTLNGIMRITWDSVTVADLNRYRVFRSDTGTQPITLGDSDSTVFYHTVFNTVIDTVLDTTEYRREYQVKSIDNENNLSVTFSDPVEFIALSPTVVKTFFTFTRVEQYRQAYQEVTIVAEYKNYKRTNNIIRWFAGEPVVLVRTDTVNAQQGKDTLVHTWPDSGLHTICIEAVDDGGSIWRDSVEVTTVLKPDVWYPIPSLNEGRRYHSTAVVDNKLYVLGGAIDFFNGIQFEPKVINSVECFSFADSTWSLLPPMPTARLIAAAVVIGKKIYVIGGRSIDITYNSIEIFDTETGQWEAADTVPFIRYGHAACAIRDSIYVFGGSNGQQDVDSILVYDPATGEWSLKYTMMTPRIYHQVVQRGDSVFILGGMKEWNAVKSVEVYNVADNSIHTGTDMQHGRMYFGAALLKDNIYVFGGAVSLTGPDILTNMEAYNPDSNTWIIRKSLPSQRHAFGTCVNKGVLYITGGSDKGFTDNLGQLKTVFQYYP